MVDVVDDGGQGVAGLLSVAPLDPVAAIRDFELIAEAGEQGLQEFVNSLLAEAPVIGCAVFEFIVLG